MKGHVKTCVCSFSRVQPTDKGRTRVDGPVESAVLPGQESASSYAFAQTTPRIEGRG